MRWKSYDNLFNGCINEKDINEMSQYFPKLYERSGGKVKV